MPKSNQKTPKIAIVHDWLTNRGGAERVVLAFSEAFPDAPIFTSVYTPESLDWFHSKDVRTTHLQNLPKPLRKLHKFFPMLRVRAFRKLDLSDYDIILSSSSAESKQVRKTRPDQIHICYCHTPIRYYWSHYHEYKKDPGFGRLNFLVRLAMPFFVPPLKRADYKAAQKVDLFLANSAETAKRIKKYYDRDATVLHPPVDTKRFTPAKKREDFYLSYSRQIPYKRVDLAILACNKLGLPLKVFGSGSEHEKLVAMAGPTITFHPDDTDEVTKAYSTCKAFIFPPLEDFGIVPIEAQAAGAPVIAYGKGGALETVIDSQTGILFPEQTPDSLAQAIQKSQKTTFSPIALKNNANRFAQSLFITKIRKIVSDAHASHFPKTKT
ncbi:glycosyltransferase [Candidatus Saccharibacteria bacterium]|nr:glycosyltransferase [Candidatus Saccharibacteria bacterium]